MINQNKIYNAQLSCVCNLCSNDNFAEIVKGYLCNMKLLKDISIIKATNTPESMNLYDCFSEISDIRDYLYTPFTDGKVNHICLSSAKSWLSSSIAYTREQRCISFDTQTVSYLDRFYRGDVSTLNQNIESVIKLMRLNNIGVDYIPYVMENMLFSSGDNSAIVNTLMSFEKLYWGTKKSNMFCKRQVNRILRLYKNMSYEMKNNWSKLYNSIYCILLKAIYIQFSNEHKSIDKKMGLFCDFIDS